jgi:acetyl-CoA carboxylase biotin carboxyl carrier protein
MPTNKFDLDSDFVRKLAKLLEETGLNEIEYAEGDRKIRCATSPRGHVVHAAPAAPVVVNTIPSADAPKAVNANAGNSVNSPMVGTVYLASSPAAAPFVKVGDSVKAGDTLVIIEAMKVMNPIKAPKGGTITEVLVSDAQPVEFGEPLVVIA